MTAKLKPEVGDDRDWIGVVVEENDPRGGTRKRIYAVEDGYALCRAGGLGDGRKSKVRIDRLYSARYTVVSRPSRHSGFAATNAAWDSRVKGALAELRDATNALRGARE